MKRFKRCNASAGDCVFQGFLRARFNGLPARAADIRACGAMGALAHRLSDAFEALIKRFDGGGVGERCAVDGDAGRLGVRGEGG